MEGLSPTLVQSAISLLSPCPEQSGLGWATSLPSSSQVSPLLGESLLFTLVNYTWKQNVLTPPRQAKS